MAYLGRAMSDANVRARTKYDAPGGLDVADKMVYMQKAAADMRAEADEALQNEFSLWLQGKHPDNARPVVYDNSKPGVTERRQFMNGAIGPRGDWKPTWWGRGQLTHLPGVRDYLRAKKLHSEQSTLDLNQLAELGPQNVDQAWAYFKTWVKGMPQSESVAVATPNMPDVGAPRPMMGPKPDQYVTASDPYDQGGPGGGGGGGGDRYGGAFETPDRDYRDARRQTMDTARAAERLARLNERRFSQAQTMEEDDGMPPLEPDPDAVAAAEEQRAAAAWAAAAAAPAVPVPAEYLATVKRERAAVPTDAAAAAWAEYLAAETAATPVSELEARSRERAGPGPFAAQLQKQQDAAQQQRREARTDAARAFVFAQDEPTPTPPQAAAFTSNAPPPPPLVQEGRGRQFRAAGASTDGPAPSAVKRTDKNAGDRRQQVSTGSGKEPRRGPFDVKTQMRLRNPEYFAAPLMPNMPSFSVGAEPQRRKALELQREIEVRERKLRTFMDTSN
jgi:hypothetical protein